MSDLKQCYVEHTGFCIYRRDLSIITVTFPGGRICLAVQVGSQLSEPPDPNIDGCHQQIKASSSRYCSVYDYECALDYCIKVPFNSSHNIECSAVIQLLLKVNLIIFLLLFL